MKTRDRVPAGTPEIVKEGGTQAGFHPFQGRLQVRLELKERNQDPPRQMKNAQAVIETRMCRTRINLEGGPELLNATKLLEGWLADDPHEPG